MKLINRSALVVTPKQPYADWVNGLDPQISGMERPLSLQEHQQEGRVYLIPETAVESEPAPELSALWRSIFDNELSAWDEFGDARPTALSLEMFHSWFSVAPQVLVFDLAEQPLLLADLDV